MTTEAFVSSFTPILKNDGTINNGGTLEFYEPGTSFATPKVVYSDSGLTTSLGSTVTLDSAGTKTIFLNGNYDLKIKDSSLSILRTLNNINPDVTSSTTDPNFILNGSFETSSSGIPSDWTLFEWNSGANVVDSSVQSHGKYSMKFVSVGSGGGYVTTSSFMPISEARTYTLRFIYKASVADVRNVVEILWYDKDQVAHSTPSTTILDDSTTNPTSFTQKTYRITPVSGALFAKLRLTGCHSSDSTTGTTWFDGVSLTEDAVLIEGNNSLVFEGATADAFETTLAITDPTADRTITIPDASISLKPVTSAELKTGTITNQFIAPDALLAALGFSAYVQTADQTITAAGALTIAHGLGRTPVLFFVFLKNTTAEFGYSIGDITPVSALNGTDAASSRGAVITADSTNIYVRYGSGPTNAFNILDKSNGTAQSATNASWSMFIRALA